MADNKRLSLGNRVATPRVGNNQKESAISIETAIARSVGARYVLMSRGALQQSLRPRNSRGISEAGENAVHSEMLRTVITELDYQSSP